MAYNYYPNYVTPYMNYSQPYTPQANQQPQIQNGGFISVRNEQEARNYPVAPGNSVTFKDETAPYVYTKTMGFSQLDRPIFDKYKLVKEDTPEPKDAVAEDIVENIAQKKLETEIENLWKEVNALKDAKKVKKKEVADNE